MYANELRRMLEAGLMSPQDLQPNELAMLVGEMPEPRYDIPKMAQNTMRFESGPDQGRVVDMDFRQQAQSAPQQPQERLGAAVEVAGKGKGRYSADGSKVVGNGWIHDLFPQRTAQAEEAKREGMKFTLDMLQGQSGLAKDAEQITSSQQSRDPNSPMNQARTQAEAAKAAAAANAPMQAKADKKAADATDVLGLLDLAEPLLANATGSLAGTGMDALAGAVGFATEGSKATAQLQALQGLLVSKMPRMEGPQSNLDVMLYREMAGKIGDSTVPVEQRKAAIQTIRSLNEKYAGVEGQQAKPQQALQVPPAAVEYLRKNPGTAAAFDAKFGQGAAARALGR